MYLLDYRFRRLKKLLHKNDCEEHGEQVAETDLKDFILFAKDSYESPRRRIFTFEELLLTSTVECMKQCGIFVEDATKIDCSRQLVNPNFIIGHE